MFNVTPLACARLLARLTDQGDWNLKLNIEHERIKMEPLKQRIQKGEAVHGCWLNMGSSLSAEIVGKSGFDWVLIDLEHGSGNEKDAFHQLQALASTDATPIVRIDNLFRHKVQRMLDMGAGGIMFPQIRTADEASQAAAMMRYPPDGIRGVATMIRATDFGSSVDAYHEKVKNDLLSIIQIETLESLENLDAIAAIGGVDVLFLGPSDLTMSMGIFRQFQHDHYQAAIRKIAEAALRHGKTAGVLMVSAEQYNMYYDLGYRFIACGADSIFVKNGAKEMINQMNELKGKYH